MYDINSFERDLAALIGKPSVLRPFVCDGSPLECKVFIVGFNPATASSIDFWTFWRSGFGFEKAAWYKNYLSERRGLPQKTSPTRRVIEWVLEGASPVKCLETNIHSFPTGKSTDLSATRRSTEPFDFLLRSIKPSLTIAHGKPAIAHIETKQIKSRVIPVRHFSLHWSKSEARDLGRRIADEFRNG